MSPLSGGIRSQRLARLQSRTGFLALNFSSAMTTLSSCRRLLPSATDFAENQLHGTFLSLKNNMSITIKERPVILPIKVVPV